MFWKEKIRLGNTSESVVDGVVDFTTTYKDVFANKLSIRQSEFYESARVNLKPELAFEVRLESYSNEEEIVYKSKSYKIVRTFENYKKGTVELYLTSAVLDG